MSSPVSAVAGSWEILVDCRDGESGSSLFAHGCGVGEGVGNDTEIRIHCDFLKYFEMWAHRGPNVCRVEPPIHKASANTR